MKRKTPTNISIHRVNATSYSDVQLWFHKYSSVLDDMNLDDPAYIYNVDEHGTLHSAVVSILSHSDIKKCMDIYT